jgi:hypothetical protein
MIIKVDAKTVACDKCGAHAPALSMVDETDDNVRKFARDDDRFDRCRGKDYCSGCAEQLARRRLERRGGRRG